MSWIQTYRSRAFSFEKDAERVYDLEEIAHALGNLCRFTGHARRFYSVAEHQIHVGNRVVTLIDQKNSTSPRWPRTTGSPDLLDRRAGYRLGLFHDTPEAYLGDVSRPVKRLPFMEGYRACEEMIFGEIRMVFELTKDPELVALVKLADDELLAAERDQVFLDQVRPEEWEWLPDPPPGIDLEFLTPEVASTRWLQAARRSLRKSLR